MKGSKLFRWFLNFMSGDALDEVDRLNEELQLRTQQYKAQLAVEVIHVNEINESRAELARSYIARVKLEQQIEDYKFRITRLEKADAFLRRNLKTGATGESIGLCVPTTYNDGKNI